MSIGGEEKVAKTPLSERVCNLTKVVKEKSALVRDSLFELSRRLLPMPPDLPKKELELTKVADKKPQGWFEGELEELDIIDAVLDQAYHQVCRLLDQVVSEKADKES